MIDIDPNIVVAGALAFLRVGGLLFTLPVVGDKPTPVMVRTLLAIAITLALLPTIPEAWFPKPPFTASSIALLVIREMMVGLSVGFLAKIFFDGLVMASTVVGFQMGFGTANLLMPDADYQMDSFTALHRILIMLIFLSLNLHHFFFSAIHDSFSLLGGGALTLHGSSMEVFVAATTGVFVIAVKLAAPILVALLFTMGALGLVARTVPQLNVFVVSFPISFAVGSLIYIACLPFMPETIKTNFFANRDSVMTLLHTLQP